MQARFEKPQKNASHLAISHCNFHLKNNAHEIFIGKDFHKARKILKDLQRCDASKVFKQFNLGYTQCNEMRRF